MPKLTKYPRLRVHVRKGKAGQVWQNYYYDMRPEGKPDVPLGNDHAEAVKRWTELHLNKPRIAGTLQEAFSRWRDEVLPKYASEVTRKGYRNSLKMIEPVFGPATWDTITPKSITSYLDKRSSKTQGNREMALLSVIWSWAVREELVSKSFPLLGERGWKNKEQARTVEVTDAMFAAVYSAGDQMIRAAMDIATATGLRLTDVRTVLMPTNGVLHVKASKTGKRASFDVLSSIVLSRVLSEREKVKANHLMLLSTSTGRQVSPRMLRDTWEAARNSALADPANAAIADEIKAMYMRDLRKRAASLAEDMEAASKLLQHSSQAVTAKHYRRGDKLKPVR